MNNFNGSLLLELPGHAAVSDSVRSILGWLGENAERFGDRPALEGINRPVLSHSGLFRHVQRVSTALNAAGLGRGDIVMIALPNGPEALSAILSVAAVTVALPVAVDEPETSLEQLFGQIPVKALLFDGSRPGSFPQICQKYGIVPAPLQIDLTQPAGLFALPALPQLSSAPATPTRLDDAAVLSKTAGTTSLPKMIANSQAGIFKSIEVAARWMELTPDDRSLCVMPFAHLHSLLRSSAPGLLCGGTVVCCPGFDKIRIFDWIDNYHPTYMTAVPGIYRSILARIAETGKIASGSSLRFLVSGSDLIEKATIETLHQAFAIPVREFYGMSEVTPMLAATPPGVPARTNDATGQLLSEWRLECRDETGQVLPVGQEGEIAVSGGLFNPVIAGDRSRVVDGWYLTYDRGFLDADGLLHVTGRMDERINSGGRKVSPQTVEAVLNAHPMVMQAVVFPIPDAILGARVGALVVPVHGAMPEPLQLRAFTAGQLPDYMVPERIIISNGIPYNKAGKLARKALAELLPELKTASPSTEGRRFNPASPTEALLVTLVSDLLEQEYVDIDADLMTIGFDSFLATSLLVAIEERFGILLSPPQFIQNRSVVALGRLLDVHAEKPVCERIHLIQAGNGVTPLFFTHAPNGYAFYAHTFAEYLGEHQTIYAFQWQEPESGQPLRMERHAAYYVEAMRSIQPSGPYYLVGHSFGAQLAFEVAQQLTAAGEDVAFLGIIDDEADLFKRRFNILNEGPVSGKIFDRCKHMLHSYAPKLYSGHIDIFFAKTAPTETLGCRNLANLLAYSFPMKWMTYHAATFQSLAKP